jgi:hypothetical protein
MHRICRSMITCTYTPRSCSPRAELATHRGLAIHEHAARSTERPVLAVHLCAANGPRRDSVPREKHEQLVAQYRLHVGHS